MSNQRRIEVRDLRNGDWYWIHKAVIQEYAQNVGAIGIAVYNLLASLADRDQGCFPSQRYIAKCLGYSRSYVNETIKLLEKNGLIRIDLNRKAFKGYKPRSREELLALDLAEALNDTKGLRLYLSYARKYPASLLWRALGEVREIPEEKIRKSRAALFNHLVRKHAKETHKNHRD